MSLPSPVDVGAYEVAESPQPGRWSVLREYQYNCKASSLPNWQPTSTPLYVHFGAGCLGANGLGVPTARDLALATVDILEHMAPKGVLVLCRYGPTNEGQSLHRIQLRDEAYKAFHEVMTLGGVPLLQAEIARRTQQQQWARADTFEGNELSYPHEFLKQAHESGYKITDETAAYQYQEKRRALARGSVTGSVDSADTSLPAKIRRQPWAAVAVGVVITFALVVALGGMGGGGGSRQA